MKNSTQLIDIKGEIESGIVILNTAEKRIEDQHLGKN
jgi:hypothetical protein